MVEVLIPGTLAEALGMLADREGAVPLAGGTDVLLDMRTGRSDPTVLVDMSRLDGLRGVGIDGDLVTIGAMTSIRTIERDAELAARSTAVPEAAHVLGSVQIRVMATLGGNLCHATPSAEMPPPLLVHGAEVDIAGPDGGRTVPLADLFAGPGATTLDPGELVAAVRYPAPSNLGSCYLRQTVRWSMDLAGVGVAASVAVDGDRITTATVALGAVAPTPFVVGGVADLMTGDPWDPERAGEAGRMAAAASSPISDARGSADYRCSVVAALVPRALGIAYRRAIGGWPVGRFSPTNGLVEEPA